MLTIPPSQDNANKTRNKRTNHEEVPVLTSVRTVPLVFVDLAQGGAAHRLLLCWTRALRANWNLMM